LKKFLSKKSFFILLLASLAVSPAYSSEKKEIKSQSQVKINKSVKNVILLIPDGASVTHFSLARWYNGGAPLAVDEIACGLVKTYSADAPIADSAPAGTAMSTGYKSHTGFVGVLPDVSTMYGVPSIAVGEERRPLASILEAAKLAGKSTGIIATSNIQHATPAGFSSHLPNRGDYDTLAEQQVYNKLDVVLGGGYKYLVKENRQDKEDMISELKSLGYEIALTKDEMKKSSSSKLWGLFAQDAMSYELDREKLTPTEPSLQDMTDKALSILSKNKDGFFLMVEGSKIDWASHANDPVGVVTDVIAFDNAVKSALDFAKKDRNTVVIVASDHGNGGLTMGNYATSKNYDKLPLSTFIDPLKKASLTGEGLEAKLNKEKSNIKEVMGDYFGITDLTDEEIKSISEAKPKALNYAVGPIISKRASLGWTTNGHTGEDVVLYMYHPSNQILTGVIQNTDIGKYMAEVMNLDLDNNSSILFNNIIPVLNKSGISYSWKNGDFINPELVISDDKNTLSIPSNKNYYVLNGKKIESSGVNVFIDGEKFYVSKKILELF
jgi:alkaline phosphatase